MKKNYYELLQVQPGAHSAIIKTAYRTMMQELKMHPDLGGDPRLAQELNEAKDVLLNPKLRHAYDQKLDLASRPQSATASSSAYAAGKPEKPRPEPGPVPESNHPFYGTRPSKTNQSDMSVRSVEKGGLNAEHNGSFSTSDSFQSNSRPHVKVPSVNNELAELQTAQRDLGFQLLKYLVLKYVGAFVGLSLVLFGLAVLAGGVMLVGTCFLQGRPPYLWEFIISVFTAIVGLVLGALGIGAMGAPWTQRAKGERKCMHCGHALGWALYSCEKCHGWFPLDFFTYLSRVVLYVGPFMYVIGFVMLIQNTWFRIPDLMQKWLHILSFQ